MTTLADLKYIAEVAPYLRQFEQPSLRGISQMQGGSTLGIATPRQQREAQAIRKQAQPVVNAVTDPFYAMTPGVDQRRQEARRRILEKVAAVATDPMAATFAGVGAKMADKAALARSLEMKAAGVPDREIWAQTGWTHGFPDGKPRFEIDDSAASFTNAVPDAVPENSSLMMGGLLRHNELFENYPNLQRISVTRGEGSYQPYPPTITIQDFSDYSRETLGHELQHAVQQREGFAKGGSTDNGIDEGMYRALAGEVEARLTQRRMSLNAQQRRQRYPIDDMDVKPQDQIVRFK